MTISGFQAEDIACKRGGRLLFEGLNLDLSPGGAALIKGPNGIGKSSLLRLIAGLGGYDRGHLQLSGIAMQDDPEAYQGKLAYLGHFNALKTTLNGFDNLRFWGSLQGGNEASITKALEAMDLSRLTNTPVRILSAGQKRRLALARVLASQASLWLLDEPANGLDQASRERLDEAIGHHRHNGGMVIAVAHGDLHMAHAKGVDLRAFTV